MKLDFRHNASISYLFMVREKIFVDEENGVVASSNYGTDYLILPSQVNCECLVHIFEFGPERRARYSSDVPMIGLVTALSS